MGIHLDPGEWRWSRFMPLSLVCECVSRYGLWNSDFVPTPSEGSEIWGRTLPFRKRTTHPNRADWVGFYRPTRNATPYTQSCRQRKSLCNRQAGTQAGRKWCVITRKHHYAEAFLRSVGALGEGFSYIPNVDAVDVLLAVFLVFVLLPMASAIAQR